MRLSELREGENGIIVKNCGKGAVFKRLSEIGFIKGQTVKVIRFAPLGDPVVYRILGTEFAVRKEIASLIEVAVFEEVIKNE